MSVVDSETSGWHGWPLPDAGQQTCMATLSGRCPGRPSMPVLTRLLSEGPGLQRGITGFLSDNGSPCISRACISAPQTPPES